MTAQAGATFSMRGTTPLNNAPTPSVEAILCSKEKVDGDGGDVAAVVANPRLTALLVDDADADDDDDAAVDGKYCSTWRRVLTTSNGLVTKAAKAPEPPPAAKEMVIVSA